MYLQLAESAPGQQVPDEMQFFLYVPDGKGGHTLVREDLLDDLPKAEWEAILKYNEQFGMAIWPFNNKKDRDARREWRAEKKESKNIAREARAAASSSQDGGGGLLDSIGRIVGNVGGGLLGVPKIGAGLDLGGGSGGSPPPPPPEKKWYENPIIWVLGAGALATGIYFIARPKKTKTAPVRRARRRAA